jgi:hypothetical protein
VSWTSAPKHGVGFGDIRGRPSRCFPFPRSCLAAALREAASGCTAVHDMLRNMHPPRNTEGLCWTWLDWAAKRMHRNPHAHRDAATSSRAHPYTRHTPLAKMRIDHAPWQASSSPCQLASSLGLCSQSCRPKPCAAGAGQTLGRRLAALSTVLQRVHQSCCWTCLFFTDSIVDKAGQCPELRVDWA